MTATIINLRQWEADHPPALRCWVAYWRMVGAWSALLTTFAGKVATFYDSPGNPRHYVAKRGEI